MTEAILEYESNLQHVLSHVPLWVPLSIENLF